MRSNWETYQGKRVFIARYDHLALEEFRAEIGAAEVVVHGQPPNSVPLLVLTEGTIISPEAVNLFKNTALRTKPFIRKTAVLGVTGARKTLLEIVVKFSGMQVVPFESMQEAKDWLVKE